MYRAITYFFIQHQVDIESKNMVINSLDTLSLDVSFPVDRPTKIMLDGEDISEDIRKKVVTNRVSQVSAIEDVRKKMVKIQKEIVSNGNFVVEGRDIGTVVFPNAEHKFFLVADYDIRAERRLKDFDNVNEKFDLSDIKNDLIRRDEHDKNRKFSPLKKAGDAIVINTSNCSVDEQVESIYKYIERV